VAVKFRFECDCGFDGPKRDAKDAAREDGRKHVNQTHAGNVARIFDGGRSVRQFGGGS
jgi:hypothetical protein